MSLRSVSFGLLILGPLAAFPVTTIAQKPTSGRADDKPRESKDPVERVAFEHSLSAEKLEELEGATVKLLMRNGDEEENVVLKKFVTGKQADRFRSVEVVINGKTTRKFNADKIFQIEKDDVAYPLSFLPTQRMYVLDDAAARRAAIVTQLRGPHRFWESLSSEEVTGHISRQKEFLNKVGAHFSRLPMQLHETKYFLFYTDMPAGQAAPFILQLDKMYEFLGQAFGIKPGTNIWQGKSPVICFINRSRVTLATMEAAAIDTTSASPDMTASQSQGTAILSRPST